MNNSLDTGWGFKRYELEDISKNSDILYAYRLEAFHRCLCENAMYDRINLIGYY